MERWRKLATAVLLGTGAIALENYARNPYTNLPDYKPQATEPVPTKFAYIITETPTPAPTPTLTRTPTPTPIPSPAETIKPVTVKPARPIIVPTAAVTSKPESGSAAVSLPLSPQEALELHYQKTNYRSPTGTLWFKFVNPGKFRVALNTLEGNKSESSFQVYGPDKKDAVFANQFNERTGAGSYDRFMPHYDLIWEGANANNRGAYWYIRVQSKGLIQITVEGLAVNSTCLNLDGSVGECIPYWEWIITADGPQLTLWPGYRK